MSNQSVQHNIELMMGELQRRIARLLLRHDRSAFRGRFRDLYAQSSLPQSDLLRAYDQYIRLISLADELFDDILPRIHRRLSFNATRLELDEEPPLRGQVDWRRTLERTIAERPNQRPTRFVTSLRSRSFATPENRLLVAILGTYIQQLAQVRSSSFFADEALNLAEQREIAQLEERVRRELATPQLQELTRDVELSELPDLLDQVSRRLRGGANPYSDLIAWWQRVEKQHLKTSALGRLTPVLQTQEQIGLLYQLWLALEIANLLIERGLLSDSAIRTDRLHLKFSWQDRDFELAYDRTPKQHLAWKDAPGERPDFFITRAQPIVVSDQTMVYWREPGVILDAKCYLGEEASRATGAIKRLIADIHLLDARHGALIFPDISGLSEQILPDSDRYLASVVPDSAIHLYAARPFENEAQLQAKLSALLDQVAAWLPNRSAIACFGCIPDRDTVTVGGIQHNTADIVFCPKPHISPTHVDQVSLSKDCLKNPRLCHIMTLGPVVGMQPPFVERVLNEQELHQAIEQLRSRLQSQVAPQDESDEAEQARSALIEAIGRLVDSYMTMRKPDTQPIEERLELIFEPYWSDADHKRGLPENVRNMLISGDFVHYEFSRGGVADWAASAVQYVRAVEHELHRRLYDRFGHTSPLYNRHGKPMKSKEFTFGTVTDAYNKRANNNQNWNTFVQQAVLPSGSKEADFEQAIAAIVGLRILRNEIAHSEKIDQAKENQVRDTTLGNLKLKQVSALRQLITLLDP